MTSRELTGLKTNDGEFISMSEASRRANVNRGCFRKIIKKIVDGRQLVYKSRTKSFLESIKSIIYEGKEIELR